MLITGSSGTRFVWFSASGFDWMIFHTHQKYNALCRYWKVIHSTRYGRALFDGWSRLDWKACSLQVFDSLQTHIKHHKAIWVCLNYWYPNIRWFTTAYPFTMIYISYQIWRSDDNLCSDAVYSDNFAPVLTSSLVLTSPCQGKCGKVSWCGSIFSTTEHQHAISGFYFNRTKCKRFLLFLTCLQLGNYKEILDIHRSHVFGYFSIVVCECFYCVLLFGNARSFSLLSNIQAKTTWQEGFANKLCLETWPSWRVARRVARQFARRVATVWRSGLTGPSRYWTDPDLAKASRAGHSAACGMGSDERYTKRVTSLALAMLLMCENQRQSGSAGTTLFLWRAPPSA